MRLDKYLKVSRLIKRRTIANQACDTGRVSVNGKPAKAGHSVKEGDEIAISFGTKTLKVKVINTAEHIKKENSADMYEAIGDE
ncbi:MAG: RNA-binding S4 domain-containing protein [Christensenellales bacterium]|jgi:ribosomal 50S subunit-recycling heat shock protein